MYVSPINFYNTNQIKRPNFTGIKAEKTLNLAQEAVSVISDIFAKPVEKRSHHLIHELNPNTGLPINGRFKLKTTDGAEITVSRSLVKAYNENIPYFHISVLKDGIKNVVRLNPDNNMIIKSQITHGILEDSFLTYYNAHELANNVTIPKILSTYLPEIKKVDMISKPTILKAQKTKAAKKSLTTEEVDNIVLNELRKAARTEDLFDNEPRRVPAQQVLVKKKSNEGANLYYLGKTKQKPNVKIFSEQYSNKLETISNAAEQYSALYNSIKPNKRKFIVTELFSGIIPSSVRAGSSIVLDMPDNLTAKISPYNGTNLLRIIISDIEGNAVRGYLVKNSENLIKNFNFKLQSYIPYSLKLMTESEYAKIAPVFEADIGAIKPKMEKIGNIIADYNSKS